MDRVHHLHEQLGSHGPPPPLPPSLQDARHQERLAGPPPAPLLSPGELVLCGSIRERLHHPEHRRGPLAGHLSPVQSQAAAVARGGPGGLRRGLGRGAGDHLPHQLPLQEARGDGLPVLPQVFGEGLEPPGDRVRAPVRVPGARAAAGLLLGPDHLGPSAVGPAQPAEPGLRENHLQRPERLPVAFYPESLGDPAAVLGEFNR